MGQRRNELKARISLWVPVFFWLAVIAHFSNQPFSKQDLAPVPAGYLRRVQAAAALPEVQNARQGLVPKSGLRKCRPAVL